MRKTASSTYWDQIGEKPVFMAPMAGVTDKAFREIIRLCGGKYVVTEMISDKALLYRNRKTLAMLDLEAEPSPRIVQIFGSRPEEMAEAARLVEAIGVDALDLNMGCPAPKIVKNGEGSALLLDLNRAVAIASQVVRAVKVPVTVKLRLGWDSERLVASELAERLEQVGIAMLTIHGRTREQFYGGQADWEAIAQVKRQVGIPVIGNGDITSPEKAQRLLLATGCDGVMIGRAALGNPWLIGQTAALLKEGCASPLSRREKYAIILLHFEKLVGYKGEAVGIKEMRKHFAWYLKGVHKAAYYRELVMRTQQPEELKEIIKAAILDND